MFSSEKYLTLANEAQIQAETTTNPDMRKHFEFMAGQWRHLAGHALESEKPGPPTQIAAGRLGS